MELIDQIDIANPDHISVITRVNKVIISVKKDGAQLTVSFPIKDQHFDSNPIPPLRQPALNILSKY
jgi:hypothetical protein